MWFTTETSRRREKVHLWTCCLEDSERDRLPVESIAQMTVKSPRLSLALFKGVLREVRLSYGQVIFAFVIRYEKMQLLKKKFHDFLKCASCQKFLKNT